MADNSKYLQAQAYSLAGAGCILGATSITLNSMLQIDGETEVTMADFGTKGFATIEPGNGTREEQIVFTGITQNANGTATLTGVSNVLMAAPYTETSGTDMSHPGGVTLVISNTSGFYNTFVNKNDDETIVGLYTFPNNGNTPVLGTVYAAPTTDLQVASKKYVDDVAIAGAPDAALTVKGIVQLGTQAQIDAGTATGSTGAALVSTPATTRSRLINDYYADTGAANAYVITPSPAISAYAAGQRFTFKATNTNTLTSTLNVNTIGAKTIKRAGAVLGAGDIISGQIYEVEYDGTDLQLLTPINSTPSGVVQMYAASSAPTGWLLCDGTSYLRTTYPALFAVISTTYGAADGTHFNVPDYRGRVPIGAGTGTGGGASGTGTPTGGSALTAVALSTWKGAETHTLTTPESPAHTHTLTGFSGGGGAGTGFTTVTNGSGAADQVSTSTGGGGAHNNIQPVMGINFIIKT